MRYIRYLWYDYFQIPMNALVTIAVAFDVYSQTIPFCVVDLKCRFTSNTSLVLCHREISLFNELLI